MMTNLMTISVKKASISSKLTTVYLSCPPLCGLFSIQQNAKGGLSYKVKKNPVCRILRLRRVALATFFHSAAVRSLAERFLCHRAKFPMTQKALSMISHEKGEISAVPPYLYRKTSVHLLSPLTLTKRGRLLRFPRPGSKATFRFRYP